MPQTLTDADISKFDSAKPSVLTDADIASHDTGGSGAAKPSLTSEFLKYSPVGFVQGIAAALRDPKSAVTGMLKNNEQLWEKAKDSYKAGDYTAAAAHFINYLVPGGGAMDDAGEDFAKGDYARGTAKTAGIATTMVAGAKAPVVLDAATEPDLPGRVATGAKGAVKGAADAATSPSTYSRAMVPELIAQQVGVPRGVTASAIVVTRLAKGAVAGARAALTERLANLKAAATSSTETVGAPEPITDPARLIEPSKTIPMPGISTEHDASYVHGVPLEEINPQMAAQSAPAAQPEVPAAAPGVDAATRQADLDGMSQSLAGKPFSKLNPREREAVTKLYDAGATKAAPSPPTAQPAAPAPAPPPSIAEQLRDEILKDPNVKPEQIAAPSEEPPAPTGAEFEAKARAAKAAALANALHKAGITSQDAAGLMQEADWKQAAQATGAKTPSGGKWMGSQTVEQTLFQLRKLERAQKVAPITSAVQ